MTRRMTKREIRRYEERLAKEATNQDPKRNRKLVKVLSILSANWAQHTGLFTEEVNIIDKKLYSVEKCSWKKENLLENGYINENGTIGALMVDYGKINYGYISNEENGIVPVYCKAEDFDKYNIGDNITVYTIWSRGYDGTMIDLYLYDRWKNHKPTITFTFL